MTAQYLLARYIPDLERMEPKNIGVVVWTPGAVACRFVDPADVDFVEDAVNFQRWLDYWRTLCGQGRLQVFNDPAVTNKTPRFLKALMRTQNGNYRLDFGGEVLSDVTAGTVGSAAEFLFTRMVATMSPPSQEIGPRAPGLKEKVRDFFAAIGILARQDYRTRFPVHVRLGSTIREIHFDYGLGVGNPTALFNRVNLANEDNVTLAAGRCQTALAHEILTKQQCVSLYDSESSGNDQSAVKFLSTFSHPVDIARPEDAKASLSSII